MVRLRLRRVGRKRQPSYRIVAAEKEAPRDGRFLEIVGFYNPRTEPETVSLKEDRVYHWLSNGAQPSDAVARILNTVGAMDRYARFKAGEAVEQLVAEAEAAEEARTGSPKTRKDGKAAKAVKKAEVKAEPAPAAEAKAEAAPAAEEPVEAAAEEAPAEEEAVAEEAPAEEKEEEEKSEE